MTSESVFKDDWEFPTEQESLNRFKSDWNISDDHLEGVKILYASYTYEDYSGDAYVLFEKNGNLYEVTGGHCSCYGLEDQFDPEIVEPKVLKERINRIKQYDKNSSWGLELNHLTRVEPIVDLYLHMPYDPTQQKDEEDDV